MRCKQVSSVFMDEESNVIRQRACVFYEGRNLSRDIFTIGNGAGFTMSYPGSVNRTGLCKHFRVSCHKVNSIFTHNFLEYLKHVNRVY